MKTKYLFPNRCKIVGIIISAPLLLILMWIRLSEYTENTVDPWDLLGGFLDELAIIGAIVGLTLATFSKEKIEDEYIAQIRSNALMFAVVTQSLLTILSLILLYDTSGVIYFVFGALVYTMVIFTVKFNIDLYRLKKSCKNEE